MTLYLNGVTLEFAIRWSIIEVFKSIKSEGKIISKFGKTTNKINTGKAWLKSSNKVSESLPAIAQ